MDWIVALFDKIFPPPDGARPRQFFAGSETPEVRGLRAERVLKRDTLPSAGDHDVPEEPPLDTAEFAVPQFPFTKPSTTDAAPQPIQPPPPTVAPPVPPMAAPSAQPKPAQPARLSAERIYKRNLMAVAATLMQQMAQSDVLSHELAIQAGCSADTIDSLLTGKSGGLTLDVLEGIAEKLNMVVTLQLRSFAQPQPQPQPKP